jgi:hypothetical protein
VRLEIRYREVAESKNGGKDYRFQRGWSPSANLRGIRSLAYICSMSLRQETACSLAPKPTGTGVAIFATRKAQQSWVKSHTFSSLRATGRPSEWLQ